MNTWKPICEHCGFEDVVPAVPYSGGMREFDLEIQERLGVISATGVNRMHSLASDLITPEDEKTWLEPAWYCPLCGALIEVEHEDIELRRAVRRLHGEILTNAWTSYTPLDDSERRRLAGRRWLRQHVLRHAIEVGKNFVRVIEAREAYKIDLQSGNGVWETLQESTDDWIKEWALGETVKGDFEIQVGFEGGQVPVTCSVEETQPFRMSARIDRTRIITWLA